MTAFLSKLTPFLTIKQTIPAKYKMCKTKIKE